MNLFKLAFPFAAWELSLLKLAMLCAGILLGSAFPNFWRPWWILLMVVFVAPSIWLSYRTVRLLDREFSERGR